MHQTLKHHEYRDLAARTVSKNFYISKGIAISGDNTVRLEGLHYAVGLVTEVQELMLAIMKLPSEERTVNIGEEIADCFWYEVGFERLFGFSYTKPQLNLSVVKPIDLVIDLSIDAGEILDIYKKTCWYDKQLDMAVSLRSRVGSVFERLEQLSVAFDFDSGVIKARNINKLVARYPEKFTEDLANNRNLEKEYEALKG